MPVFPSSVSMAQAHSNTNTLAAGDRQFFKYMSRQTAKTVLTNGTLRWSTPGTLNDPYDMQFDLHLDLDKEAVKTRALQNLWDAFYSAQPAPAGNILGETINVLRHRFPRISREDFNQQFGETIDESLSIVERTLPEMQAQFRSVLAASKILCLTEIFDSALMWAHYGEQHQGLLLRFRSATGLDSPWRTARPVQYFANMPKLMDNNFLADIVSGGSSLDAQSIMDRMIYTKALEWAYEHEWRIYSGMGRDRAAAFEDLPFHPQELDAVIFGYRMTAGDRAELSDLCQLRFPHADRLQIERLERQFKLRVAPFAP